MLVGTLLGIFYLVTFRVAGPYLGDLAQCARMEDAPTRDTCVTRVLDDIARDQGLTITPADGVRDRAEEL